jgi:hypothetical protein
VLCVALVNATPADHSPLAGQLAGAGVLARIAAALQVQLQQHVAPVWPYATGAIVREASGPSDVGASETPATITPTLADAPGDIAYHDNEDDGIPDEFLGLDTCNTLDDVTEAISHENAEVCGDPPCNVWITVPAGLAAYPQGVSAGQQIAQELSDPVQDRSYPIDLGDGGPPVMVSDFCYPAYFDTSLTGPTTYGEDKCGLPRIEPFQRSSGGYQLVRNADGSGETQAMGKIHPRKLDRAKQPSSRLHRRGVRPDPDRTGPLPAA